MCGLIKVFRYQLFFSFLFLSLICRSQNDTLVRDLKPVDTVLKQAPVTSFPSTVDSVLAVHSPKKAAIRSAILPGWGQAYNKKYWKIPIVYGALGTTAVVFKFNLDTYNELRFAYKARVEAATPRKDPVTGDPLPPDSTNFNKLERIYRDVLSPNDIRIYRDEYRKYIDYSVLVFILLWGLNVVDATVDAHLKSFDVSPDLSLRFVPGKSQMAGTTGLSLVLNFK